MLSASRTQWQRSVEDPHAQSFVTAMDIPVVHHRQESVGIPQLWSLDEVVGMPCATQPECPMIQKTVKVLDAQFIHDMVDTAVALRKFRKR